MTYRSLLVVLAIVASSPALAFDVTQCGDVVPRREIGVLTADLDCAGMQQGICDGGPNDGAACTSNAACPSSACFAYGVMLEQGATLQLQGHTISGGPMTWSFDPAGLGAVFAIGTDGFSRGATGKGTVTGPGGVLGSMKGGGRGPFYSPGLLSIANVDFIGGAIHCSPSCTIKADNVTIVGGYIYAAGGKLKLTDVAISNSPFGAINGGIRSLEAENLTIDGCVGTGISAVEKVTGTGVTVTGCSCYYYPPLQTCVSGGGVTGHFVKLVDSRIEGNADFGVLASRRVDLRNVDVLNNGGNGVQAGSPDSHSGYASFLGGSVLGNGLDVYSRYRPRGTVTCGTSNNWGFCAND